MLFTFLLIFNILCSKETSTPPKYVGIHPKRLRSFSYNFLLSYFLVAPRYTGSTFTCFDGSKVFVETTWFWSLIKRYYILNSSIPISSVNDGYCDCPDGSDEPGTSACQQGRFWCNNANSNGYYISSSSVNDGISGILSHRFFKWTYPFSL